MDKYKYGHKCPTYQKARSDESMIWSAGLPWHTCQSLRDQLGRSLQNCCENVYLLPQIVYDFIFITLYFSVNSLYLLCRLFNFVGVPESGYFIAEEEKVKMWECSFLQEHFANWEPSKLSSHFWFFIHPPQIYFLIANGQLVAQTRTFMLKTWLNDSSALFFSNSLFSLTGMFLFKLLVTSLHYHLFIFSHQSDT